MSQYSLKYPIFSFYSSKSFQTGCCWFVFPFMLCNASHSKQADVFSFPPFHYYHFPRGRIFSDPFIYQDIFLIRFFISLLCIKPLVSINKQFSIDSFLDWEGHHCDFCSSCSSRHLPQFSPSLQLIPTHLTR